MSSFEINKVNSFPILAAPFLLISFSNLFVRFKAKLITNVGTLSLAKGIARSIITFFT